MTSRTSLPKSKIRILLLEGIHPNAVSTLNDAGYTSIETIAGSLKEEELIEKLRGVHMLGIRSRTQITRRLLEAADKLIAIGCFCIGTNQVDLGAALEAGIRSQRRLEHAKLELVIAGHSVVGGVPEKNALMHRVEKKCEPVVRNQRQEPRHCRLREYRLAGQCSGGVSRYEGVFL